MTSKKAATAGQASGLSDKQRAEIDKLSFEEAMTRLEGLVNELEQGQMTLDRSVEAFAMGTALQKHCAGKLRAAELRIEQISGIDSAEPTLSPFESGQAGR